MISTKQQQTRYTFGTQSHTHEKNIMFYPEKKSRFHARIFIYKELKLYICNIKSNREKKDKKQCNRKNQLNIREEKYYDTIQQPSHVLQLYKNFYLHKVSVLGQTKESKKKKNKTRCNKCASQNSAHEIKLFLRKQWNMNILSFQKKFF